MATPAIHLDMARDENWTPSRRLQSAVVAERERLARRLTDLDAEVASLRNDLLRAETSRRELQEQLAMLNRLVHGAEFDSSNGHAIEATGSSHVAQQVVLGSHAERAEVLRGQAIREAAVRVLVSSNRAHEALHYREWFELLLDAGMLPAGKDPLATFLTQLGRSPVVAKSTSQGIYMLDHEFVHRAHQRLGALTQELRETQLSPVAADADALGNTRRRRAELMSEVERTEMELEEALRSLGGAGEQQLLAAAGA